MQSVHHAASVLSRETALFEVNNLWLRPEEQLICLCAEIDLICAAVETVKHCACMLRRPRFVFRYSRRFSTVRALLAHLSAFRCIAARSAMASSVWIGRDRWQPDHTADDCTDCKDKFSFMNRRHHCRMCGQLFCGDCSNRRVHGKRVCGGCYRTASKVGCSASLSD